MNDEERKKFIINEIEAIYDEFETSVDQLVLLKSFFKDLIAVSKGGEPSRESEESLQTIRKLKRIK